MATITRKNAWNQNGTFTNSDLLWYAKAVGEMQTRALNDETSWWFFAAIHGSYWQNIPDAPTIPTTPLPTPAIKSKYWDQCQHGTWFFLPWHRGYLFAIENILRGIIINLGGPADWALPYWNYFGPGNQAQIPPAFTDQFLPDGSINPLYVTSRYGPNNDKNIFIPISAWGINQDCQSNADFTGDQPHYYGGDETGFEHSGYANRGSIEENPHNFVHGAIGGQQVASGRGGLMSNPNTAALDPIFYLHHCNIDRLWAHWNASGKNNPTDPNWGKGPTAAGNRKFYMPKSNNTAWSYTPDDLSTISQLNYTYDDISLPRLAQRISRNMQRMHNFGWPLPAISNLSAMDKNASSELVGATGGSVELGAAGTHASVKLNLGGWNKVTKSISKAFISSGNFSAPTKRPDEVYLQLEGVKGKEDSIVCSVSVNDHYAGHISLFGLQNASSKESPHGSAGLTIRLDISKIIDKLHLSSALDVSALDVLIQPVNIISEGNNLTIDRISIYRKG